MVQVDNPATLHLGASPTSYRRQIHCTVHVIPCDLLQDTAPRACTILLLALGAEIIELDDRTDQHPIIEVAFVVLIDVAFMRQHKR